MGASFKSLGQRGISPIVGEILMIAIITAAMCTIAYFVLTSVSTPERYVDLEVRVENASPPDPANDNTFDNIKVILYHMGGDSLGIPKNANDDFRVIGSNFGENFWENTVPWDGWSFSDPADGLEMGENVMGTLRHDDAAVHIGDKLSITVTDLRTDKPLYHRTLTVENSAIYV